MENNNPTQKEVLLKVEHLEQFFKFGKFVNRAVNDVNFEIYKGEVFGLVGESGCGKTTTGRSIIRLYNITGGSVYFRGHRICAGTRRYKERISQLEAELKARVKELKEQLKANPDESERINSEIATLKAEYAEKIAEQKNELKSAKFDHKNCNKEYAKRQEALVNEKYAPLLENASEEEKEELEKQYKEELRLAKKDSITNKIQMIFQDPIASLNPRMTVREIISEGLIIRGIKDKAYIEVHDILVLRYMLYL